MDGTESKFGYMCAVDFRHELGHAMGGNRVFASVEDLKKHFPCVNQCGIVMVEVVFKKTVQKADYSKTKRQAQELANFANYFSKKVVSKLKPAKSKVVKKRG